VPWQRVARGRMLKQIDKQDRREKRKEAAGGVIKKKRLDRRTRLKNKAKAALKAKEKAERKAVMSGDAQPDGGQQVGISAGEERGSRKAAAGAGAAGPRPQGAEDEDLVLFDARGNKLPMRHSKLVRMSGEVTRFSQSKMSQALLLEICGE